MGLLNIQIYLVFLSWGCADIDVNIDFLRIDPKNVDNLDLVVFGALRRVSFGFKSSPLLDQ
jgi:hypothetical protein